MSCGGPNCGSQSRRSPPVWYREFPTWFVITLHDAIYTTDASIGDVVNEFEAATGNISFRMWFKVELALGTA